MPDAVVLAGGGTEPGLGAGLANKGFIVLAGRPLVAHVVRALQSTRSVGRIAAVGPVQALRAALPAEIIPVDDAGGIMGNVVRALETLGSTSRTLVVASDIPLLTPQAVEDFLFASENTTADFHYAIVPQEAMERVYPGARKTFVRVADGTFTGGSVMLFNPSVVDRVRTFVDRVVAARKKPWMLAQLFGWSVVMKFASGRLTIAEMQDKVTEILGIAARAIISPHPELALDVDVGKPENLEIIRRALEAYSRDIS
jgi:molybdopterin-guanine dinucleotide biosynthesis protein A